MGKLLSLYRVFLLFLFEEFSKLMRIKWIANMERFKLAYA